MRLKQALPKLRRSQPFNKLTTNGLRACFRALRMEPGFVARKLRRVGEVNDKLPNGRQIRLWTEDDDLIANEVFWRGWAGFEPETLPLWFRLAARAKVTLDVGAHVGLFALVAAHANPGSLVYAIEAMPSTCRRLELNVRLNRLTNVRCLPVAVADYEGTSDAYFNTGLELCAEASLRRECTQSFARYSTVGEIRTITVKVTTLDRLLMANDVEPVDLLKLDIEGAEPAALRGMASRLERDRPTIFCEVLRGFGVEDALQDLLEPLGYRYFLLTPNGPEPKDRIEGQPEERWELRNYLFTALSTEEIARLTDPRSSSPMIPDAL